MASEQANGPPAGLSESDNIQQSEMSGASLLLVIGKPISADYRDLILDRITQGLKLWDLSASGANLSQELQTLAAGAPVGDEGSNGERIIEHSSDQLNATILVFPHLQTVTSRLRQFFLNQAKHRLLVYAGHAVYGAGDWLLQDDVLNSEKFAAITKEADVENALKQQDGGILNMSVFGEGSWNDTHMSKLELGKSLQVSVNPAVKDADMQLDSFMDYIGFFVKVKNLKELLQPSDVVGNIRFSRPTLYIFPGSQGDSALFGISGFNLLVNGGYDHRGCFWDFTRHLDRIDGMLVTHLGVDNLLGVSSVLERKAQENIHPEIGHVFLNALDSHKHSPNGDLAAENGGAHKPASLLLDLAEEGSKMVQHLHHIGQGPHPLTGTVTGGTLQPVNLYHKVGHGTLDMYVLNPVTDSKDLKEFFSQWSKQVKNFSNSKSSLKVAGKEGPIPLPNNVSVSALLVWKPSSPTDMITRILFPGNAPQNKVFEGLDKIKNIDIFQNFNCSYSSLHAPKATKKAPAGKPTGRPTSAASKPEPRKPAPERKAPVPSRKVEKTVKEEKNTKKAAAEKKKMPTTAPAKKKSPASTPPSTTPDAASTKSVSPVAVPAAAVIDEHPKSPPSSEVKSPEPVENKPAEEEKVEAALVKEEETVVEAPKVPSPEPVIKQEVEEPQESVPEPEPLIKQEVEEPKESVPEPEPVIKQEAEEPQQSAPEPEPVISQEVQEPQESALEPELEHVIQQEVEEPKESVPEPEPVVSQGVQESEKSEDDSQVAPQAVPALDSPEPLPDPSHFDQSAFAGGVQAPEVQADVPPVVDASPFDDKVAPGEPEPEAQKPEVDEAINADEVMAVPEPEMRSEPDPVDIIHKPEEVAEAVQSEHQPDTIQGQKEDLGFDEGVPGEDHHDPNIDEAPAPAAHSQDLADLGIYDDHADSPVEDQGIHDDSEHAPPPATHDQLADLGVYDAPEDDQQALAATKETEQEPSEKPEADSHQVFDGASPEGLPEPEEPGYPECDLPDPREQEDWVQYGMGENSGKPVEPYSMEAQETFPEVEEPPTQMQMDKDEPETDKVTESTHEEGPLTPPASPVQGEEFGDEPELLKLATENIESEISKEEQAIEKSAVTENMSQPPRESPQPEDVVAQSEPLRESPQPEDVEAQSKSLQPDDIVAHSEPIVQSEPLRDSPQPDDMIAESEPLRESPQPEDMVAESEPLRESPQPEDVVAQSEPLVQSEPMRESPQPEDVVAQSEPVVQSEPMRESPLPEDEIAQSEPLVQSEPLRESPLPEDVVAQSELLVQSEPMRESPQPEDEIAQSEPVVQSELLRESPQPEDVIAQSEPLVQSEPLRESPQPEDMVAQSEPLRESPQPEDVVAQSELLRESPQPEDVIAQEPLLPAEDQEEHIKPSEVAQKDTLELEPDMGHDSDDHSDRAEHIVSPMMSDEPSELPLDETHERRAAEAEAACSGEPDSQIEVKSEEVGTTEHLSEDTIQDAMVPESAIPAFSSPGMTEIQGIDQIAEEHPVESQQAPEVQMEEPVEDSAAHAQLEGPVASSEPSEVSPPSPVDMSMQAAGRLEETPEVLPGSSHTDDLLTVEQADESKSDISQEEDIVLPCDPEMSAQECPAQAGSSSQDEVDVDGERPFSPVPRRSCVPEIPDPSPPPSPEPCEHLSVEEPALSDKEPSPSMSPAPRSADAASPEAERAGSPQHSPKVVDSPQLSPVPHDMDSPHHFPEPQEEELDPHPKELAPHSLHGQDDVSPSRSPVTFGMDSLQHSGAGSYPHSEDEDIHPRDSLNDEPAGRVPLNGFGDDISDEDDGHFNIVDGPQDSTSPTQVNPFLGMPTEEDPLELAAAAAKPLDPMTASMHQDVQANYMAEDQLERDSLEREFDPIKDWGNPLGLPAPSPPGASAPEKKPGARTAAKKEPAKKPATARSTAAADKKAAADTKSSTTRKPATRATPATARTKKEVPNGKPAREKSVPEKNGVSKDAAPKKAATTPARKPRPATAPVKAEDSPKTRAPGRKVASAAPAKSASAKPAAPVVPFYVDLTYVPNHGNPHYVDVDFFRRVRARYYVLSALSPSPSVLNALLEAKGTWDQPDAEVTLIPTYDTDTLRHWMGLNHEQLAQLKVNVAPSASRCTIQLQDHETSCAAYRLEF